MVLLVAGSGAAPVPADGWRLQLDQDGRPAVTDLHLEFAEPGAGRFLLSEDDSQAGNTSVLTSLFPVMKK